MSYSDSVKIRAYSMFLQGDSFEAIAKALSQELEKRVSPTTIKNWASKEDSQGKTWHDFRTETRAVATRNVEIAEQSRIESMASKTRTLQDKVYEGLLEDFSIKSPEGAIYAFKALGEFELKLNKEIRGDKSTVVIIQTMLDLFCEIPEVGNAVNKHFSKIAKLIEERILQSEGSHE